MTTAIVPPSPTAVNQAATEQTLLTAYVGASRVLNAFAGALTATQDAAIQTEALRALEQRDVDPYQPWRGREGNYADESMHYPGDPVFNGRRSADAAADALDETLGVFDMPVAVFEEAA